jgi:hypothetical protein
LDKEPLNLNAAYLDPGTRDGGVGLVALKPVRKPAVNRM